MSKSKLEKVYNELLAQLSKEQLLKDELLSKHTTFKIGGPADLFVMPHTLAELCFVMKVLGRNNVKPTVIGGGSNVLVLDGGVRGVMLCLSELKYVLAADDQGVVRAGAGIQLKDVSQFTKICGLTGLEFAVGIPGTIGGAIFMNAGAYTGEMSSVVSCVRTVDLKGQIHEYTLEECLFGYRQSLFQQNGEIIGEIELQLSPGEIEAIEMVMKDLTFRRESRQPLEWPSAGSTFKRPVGNFAGTLIDKTGLKGFSVGGAAVSEKHAGFVINTGNATAADVLNLITEIQKRIKKEHGIALEPEVRIMGETLDV